jgi:putative membrane protein
MITKLRMMTVIGAAALALASCNGGGGGGRDHSDTMQRMSAGLSDTDRSFITKASQANYAEIAAGQAATKSQNAAIRDFGVRMVKDHSEMNNELTVIATKKGIQPPTSAGVTNSAENAYLNALPGQTFDSQYVSRQISDHQATLQLLQQQASAGQDAELRAFAEKYIPVVQRHLTALQALQTQTSQRTG